MADTDSSTDGTLFSRSTGLPRSMGKATSTIKCNCPDVIKDDFTQLWRSLGFGSESEFLLDMVLVRLYGRDAVLRMRESTLRMATGDGTESERNPATVQPLVRSA